MEKKTEANVGVKQVAVAETVQVTVDTQKLRKIGLNDI